jgi:hypothetical protein
MNVFPWLIALLLMTGAAIAELPKPKPKIEEKALLQCFIQDPQADHMESRIGTLRGLTYIMVGLFAPGADSESPFAVMVYPFKGYGQMNPFPTMYQLDTDQDGQLDQEWVDEMGNGRCDQMRQVPLQTAQDKEM